jgi:magnesium-transporting ATPase (P-type)
MTYNVEAPRDCLVDGLEQPDEFFTAFFVTQFACFLLYDAWLIARDRALQVYFFLSCFRTFLKFPKELCAMRHQCAFFTTPKSALAAVVVLISLVFVVICFSCSKGFRLTPRKVFMINLYAVFN